MSPLFLNQYFPPDEAATAQILGDLASEAARAGMAVRVICGDRSYFDPSRRYPHRERWHGVAIERVRRSGFGRQAAVGRMVDYATYLIGTLIRALSGPKPDVIVALSTPPILGALGAAVARIRGARSVYWVMDVYPDIAFELGALRAGSVAGRIFAAISRWTLRSSGLVIALGDTMATRLRDAGAKNVIAVHNWADGEAIRPLPSAQSQYRRARGWRERFVVLYSGNLGLAHEFETVLDAAARLADRPVVFAFVGSGPRLDEARAIAAHRRLANVEFHPHVTREDLGDLLAAGDLHLVTLRPGIPGLLVPSKVYGILAAGRPTLYVGPDEGEVRAIVRRGCGAAVPNGDVDRLVETIEVYRTDETRRRREGLAARRLVDAEFTNARQTGLILAALAAGPLCNTTHASSSPAIAAWSDRPSSGA